MPTSHPAQLHLPGGIVADLIPGTRPARYAGWDGSVEIPADLRGFYWHGSYLTNGVLVFFTADYGFPDIWQAARHACLRTGYEPPLVQLGLFDIAA